MRYEDRLYNHDVYPACAGIHLRESRSQPRKESLPRMRGDPPFAGITGAYFKRSTPHARGSTFGKDSRHSDPVVYPACAGIHPWKSTSL